LERRETLFRMFGKFFPEGTILFNENDPGEEMFFLQEGAVRLRFGGEGAGSECVLGPGDILGEEALLRRSPRTYMAEVTADSRMLVIESTSLEKVVRNGPELSAAIMAELMKKLDGAWEGLRRWQLSFFLGKIEAYCRGLEQNALLPVTEVSENTEIEEEGVRRVMERLAEEGAVTREGSDYRVADREVLARLARELR